VSLELRKRRRGLIGHWRVGAAPTMLDIMLNIAYEATHALIIGSSFLSCQPCCADITKRGEVT